MAAVVSAVWSCNPRDDSATFPEPQSHSATVLQGRGGGGGWWRGRRGGGGGGVTLSTRRAAAVVLAVWSCDPRDGLATCPEPQSHSSTVVEGRGGGGGRWRGRPGGGGGGTLVARPVAAVVRGVWSCAPPDGHARKLVELRRRPLRARR